MTVTPHIGSNYSGSTAYVGTKLTFQTKVQNDGDVPLQIVANLTPPTDWDVNDNYNDCPTNLGAGNMCTFTWIFTPQVSEQIYLRVYVRGLYTDSDGNTQRITSSPAFGFNILTTGQVRSTSAVLPTYWFPHMTVTPHVGSSYYGSWAHVGTQLTFQTKVQNDGDVPLQVVANLTPPTDWDVNDNYNDCPTNLAVGSMCTFTWLFTPRVSGQVNVRVYVRGLYTDSYGNTQRITSSPAFFFNAEP
jgi:hypothetical protein